MRQFDTPWATARDIPVPTSDSPLALAIRLHETAGMTSGPEHLDEVIVTL